MRHILFYYLWYRVTITRSKTAIALGVVNRNKTDQPDFDPRTYTQGRPQDPENGGGGFSVREAGLEPIKNHYLGLSRSRLRISALALTPGDTKPPCKP